MASRRAYADEYAVRINRAVKLLADLSPADAVRGLQAEFVFLRKTFPCRRAQLSSATSLDAGISVALTLALHPRSRGQAG